MRYLVITISDIAGNKDVFFTEWFEPENHFVPGMVVIDTHKNIFTDDGQVWQEIEFDHL